MGKLTVLPRKAGKTKKGDAAPAAVAAATQLVGKVLPFAAAASAAPVFVELTEELKGRTAYRTLRQERTNAKMFGKRAAKVSRMDVATGVWSVGHAMIVI